MTREEKEKAIDALKISAPVIAVTPKEYNDYIQTLNKIMDWLEQEPCDDMVSRGVFDQVRWERDIAIGQLKELGYEFGEKQEPCEDTISRQATLASIKNLYPDIPVMDIFGSRRKWLEKYAPYFECENAVEQLPSVNPTKTGHWIKHDTDHSIYYDCSLCNCVAPCTETADKILWKLSAYCPDCGAKMKNDGERWRLER